MTTVYNLDTSSDISENIIAQYDQTTALAGLILAQNAFYAQDVKGFWDSWIQDTFNLNTATRFGLIVWAIILGCSDYVEMTYNLSGTSFGFGQYRKNFYQSNFAVSSYIASLSDVQLRKLLKAQMFNFNSSATIPEMNRLLKILFPLNNTYVTYSVENNTLTFNFPIPLDDDDLSLVLFSNALPVPLGVRRTVNNGNNGDNA